jgi:hypothetical protein
MSQLARAAREALARRGERPSPSGEITRVSMDVELDGATSMVSLQLSRHGLLWSCSCGKTDCPHALLALELLAGTTAAAAATDAATASPAAPAPQGLRVSVSPGSRSYAPELLVPKERKAFAEALDDVLLATLRSGVEQAPSAALEEALTRMLATVPQPPAFGPQRLYARLSRALHDRDAGESALLLAATRHLCADLRASTAAPDAVQRLSALFGASPRDSTAVLQMSDRALLEIARATLDGAHRAALERRYLVDLDDGSLYAEGRVLSEAHDASVGPCPRLVRVSLASRETATVPPRIHILQYTVTPELPAGALEKVALFAEHDFGVLPARYAEVRDPTVPLSEPFALLAPAKVELGTPLRLLDGSEHALPLTGSDAEQALRAALARDGAELAWIAGMLVARGDVLALAPLGAGVRRAGTVSHEEL